MEDILSFLPGFELSKNFAGDLSLLLLFVGLSLIFGFVFGRSKLISVLIDVYVARALVAILPHDWISSASYSNVIIFALLFLFLLAMDQRLFDIHISNVGADFFWRIFVTSILVTGLVVSSFFFFLPKAVALDFISVTAYGYFASPAALIFWMVTPLLSLLFINNRLK
ncbi:MAG: hypothetical protein A2808_01200 [Candidatus Moranbacteria bacterium RIFCSPHIGHO2_01_FULL_55_24]|nr:MAG: hypothetical protein A2808_01200 [Candidatus Moranbacteria bacterium RIFCSPHIGHO2_01_FULL_55_24]